MLPPGPADATQAGNGSAGQHAPGLADEREDSARGRPPAGGRMSGSALREFVFCAALALTTYGALHNTPPKISKHPQPIRFFPEGSQVTDWYRGHLKDALVKIGRADVSLVMYYAPWDAECQHVREQFDRAADVMSSHVYFAAINCWNPGSECRLQHNKMPSWPVIMAYTVNSKGVLYRGPRDAHSLVKFLELVMRPLKRVSSAGDLVNMVAVCDAVAVGFTPMNATPRHYNLWYSVALKTREHDPLGEICFAVVTSEDLAIELGIQEFPAARYMLWNETLEYQGDEEAWTEGLLIQWVLEHLTQPAARIIPMWQKAFSFQRFANGNPLLILFTPLNPLYEQQPSYDLLREVAMEYYDCTSNQWTQEIIRLQRLQRLIYQQRNIIKFCNEYKSAARGTLATSKEYKREMLSQYAHTVWHNGTYKKATKNGFFGMLLKNDLRMNVLAGEGKDSELSLIDSAKECETVFPADKDAYGNFEQCQIHGSAPIFEQFKPYDTLTTSMLSGESDPRSAERLVTAQLDHYCHLARFAQQRGKPVHPHSSANRSSVLGMACETNSSLNFVAIDGIRNHHFAEWLGIDLGKREDKTAVVILDSKHESQYVLAESYSEKSLRDFVANYTKENLKRTLRSLVRDTDFTHYYGSSGLVREQCRDSTEMEIPDLTTRTFSHFVKRSGKVGVVLVCGGSCPSHATCSVLSAVRLLAAFNVCVAIARLDALRHDLPWQYTVANYPAVLVFSADRRLESSSYPAGEQMSSDGMVALIMRTLGPPAKLHIQLAMCNKALVTDTKKTCLKDMRRHVVTLIGRTLNNYRRVQSEGVRRSLFTRLQNLRQVSFDLDSLHVSDVYVDNAKQHTLLNSLSCLAKTWDLSIPIFNKSNEKEHSS